MKELEKAVLAVMLGKKEERVDEAKKPLHPNQQKLDVHEPEKDELTAKDFETLRAGKKAKMKEEAEEVEGEQVEEGWDDMIKAAKARSGPQPSGGSGVKQGTRYGGSKQKPEKEEKNEKEDMKEEVSEVEYTFSDYLQVAKAKFGDDDAVRIANEAFNNKDVSIFSSHTEA